MKHSELRHQPRHVNPRIQDKKVVQRSNNTITVTNYVGSKFDVDAVCMICGHKWKIRADHLIERCWCPNCKKQTIN